MSDLGEPPANYGFDSFNNDGSPDAGLRIFTELIELDGISLQREPIFSGVSTPGSLITARMYDRLGNFISEVQARSDSGGNWKLQFHRLEIDSYFRVEFQQTNVSNLLDFMQVDPANDAYREMNQMRIRVWDPSQRLVLENSAHHQLKSSHLMNNRPIKLGTNSMD